MVETKSIDAKNAAQASTRSNYDPAISQYLVIEGEQVLRIVKKPKVEVQYKGVGLRKAAATFKETIHMVASEEKVPELPLKNAAGHRFGTTVWKHMKIPNMVITNDRVFFLGKNLDVKTTMAALSLVYNAEAKPLLVKLNQNITEHREDLKAMAEAGDKSAKKELYRRGMDRTGARIAHINDLRGWWELKDVNLHGKEIELELNWNTAPHMEASGITTIEAMKATMGAPYSTFNPLKVSLKMKPDVAQEVYSMLRRGLQ
jgi:hypothetical protein